MVLLALEPGGAALLLISHGPKPALKPQGPAQLFYCGAVLELSLAPEIRALRSQLKETLEPIQGFTPCQESTYMLPFEPDSMHRLKTCAFMPS